MSAPLLAARDIRKRYGSLEILRGVTLSVMPGEAFAIIGPNGAGKTTLFKVLTGETLDFTGTVTFEDRDIGALPSYRRVRAGFGRTFQVARVFPGMSTLANVVVAVEVRQANEAAPNAGRREQSWWDWRPSPRTRAAAIAVLDSVGLRAGLDAPASLLSHGDKKRLELAITLAGEPRVLMLDEPTAGMSIEDRKGTAALLAELKRRGITIVITEHDMNVVFDLADRILVLNHGEVVCLGTPKTIRTDEAVKRIYLGEAALDA